VIRDKPGYFAQKMQRAMKGLGTDDDAMVRIVVSRCECDMVQIKQSFEQQFKGRLGDWIKVSC
jgi:Annexin